MKKAERPHFHTSFVEQQQKEKAVNDVGNYRGSHTSDRIHAREKNFVTLVCLVLRRQLET